MDTNSSRSQSLDADHTAEVRHIQSPMTDAGSAEPLNGHGECEVPGELQRIGRETQSSACSVKIDGSINIPRPARDWAEEISREEVAHLVNAFEEPARRTIGEKFGLHAPIGGALSVVHIGGAAA